MVENDKIYEEINSIKNEALLNGVPIMQDDTIEFITDYIAKNNIRKILEIGSAVGYSSIMMALSSLDVTVVTIERDKDRYLEAVKNIKNMNLSDRITIIFNDALNVKFNEKFDLIIIDAAKSKNLEFFNSFEKNLEVDGAIITDNLKFHGYVDKDLELIPSRNIRGLVRKIRVYVDFLKSNDKYDTKFLDLGDGISVSERRI